MFHFLLSMIANMKFLQFTLPLLCCFFIPLLPASSSRPAEDEVTNLPGLTFQVRFRHYSGYLDAGEGNFYHYWFLESQSQPSADPLIVFLNGGPGCSSLVALFTECGPFRIKEAGKKIVENPYAWTKLANMLFIESPSGTGFSYSNGPWNLSDAQVLIRHHTALLSFYSKYPEFRGRPLYLMGQSYAAVYMVTLAGYISKNSKQFPGVLKGIAIGNGVLSLPQIINSQFYYNYYHGLLEEKQWRNVIDQCCQAQPEWKCNLFYWYSNSSSKCYQPIQDALAVASKGRDPYNIYFDCYRDSSEYASDEECGVPFGNITKHYLDREDVRVAAHIPLNRFKNYSFEACSDAVQANYTKQYIDMSAPMTEVLNAEIRVMMFNGDFDSVCNFLGAQWFVDGLNRKKTGERTPIFYNGITQPNVGYQQNYDGIDYLIIKGAGHYVPADRPRESLQIVANFLRGQSNYSVPFDGDVSLAPLIVNNCSYSDQSLPVAAPYRLSESSIATGMHSRLILVVLLQCIYYLAMSLWG